MSEPTEVPGNAVRVLTTIGASAVSGWSLQELATITTILVGLSALFINITIGVDWWWKRFGKAFAQRRGWVSGPPRDFMDSTGSAPLEGE